MTSSESWSTSYTTRSTSVQVTAGTPLPDVFIPYDLWSKMQAYVQAAAPTEVAGFGRTTRLEEKGKITYVVNDIFILEQEVSGGHADTNGPAMHQFLYEIVAAGGDTSDINFQWHSHVNGGTFFSPIDTKTIDGWTGEMLISCVTNLRGEHNTRIDWYYPQLRFGIERKLIIGTPPIDHALKASIAAEVAEKVKKRPTAPYRPVSKVKSKARQAASRRNGQSKSSKAVSPLKELSPPPATSDQDDLAIELVVPSFEDEGEDDDPLAAWRPPGRQSLAERLGHDIWSALPHLTPPTAAEDLCNP